MNIRINFKSCVAFISFMMLSNSIIAQNLRVGSYNLRYDNPSDSLNNWKYRKSTIAKLILFHDFDIFGSQEGLHHQLEELSEKLPEYKYIGVGRDDGVHAGEHSAIFYKTNKFILLKKGDFWLSLDSTKPNNGWDAVLPRICSWAFFKDKTTGFKFYLFNTHFDHVGTIARIESSKLILQKIEQIAGNAPVILTGDFNVDQTSSSYKILNGSHKIEDAFDKSELNYGAEGTFNGFDINTNTRSRIDHVFVSTDFQVKKHGILTDTYQTNIDNSDTKPNAESSLKEITLYNHNVRLPSDHYPVLTILKELK